RQALRVFRAGVPDGHAAGDRGQAPGEDGHRHRIPDPAHPGAVGGAARPLGRACPAPPGDMMTKIVLNGAGSVEFTKELLADILSFDELAGSTIALFDTDGERLDTGAAIARWTAAAPGAPAGGGVGPPATREPHLDRRAALDGADHVISMIRAGGHEGLRLDFE